MGIQKENIFGYLTESWSEERKLTGLVIALMFHTVVGYPLVSVIGSSVAIQLTNNLVLFAVLLLGLFALTHHKYHPNGSWRDYSHRNLCPFGTLCLRSTLAPGVGHLAVTGGVNCICEHYSEICLQRRPGNLAAHSSSRCGIPAYRTRIRFRLYADLLSHPRGLRVRGKGTQH